MTTDEVQRPSHYLLANGREAFEAVIGPLCDTLASRGFSGRAVYAIGNALKYLSRLGAKGTGTGPTDLRKSIRYLEMALGAVEADDTALANQIYREMRDDEPALAKRAREIAESTRAMALEALRLSVSEIHDAPSRVAETVEAIRAFHAAEDAPAAGPPPGLEEARRACRLAPFPVTGAPREVAWADVPPGSIVWVPRSGFPEIAVRWSSGRGEWCGPCEVPWEWDLFWTNNPVWVVAEGLSDAEIRAWILGSRKPA